MRAEEAPARLARRARRENLSHQIMRCVRDAESAGQGHETQGVESKAGGMEPGANIDGASSEHRLRGLRAKL